LDSGKIIMKYAISVIICTYNPRRDYLEKVIAALKNQTLSMEQWELLLIDNASDTVLALEFDLSWHPNAHHIREEQLGLTAARMRGIEEAKAETLVFVDDDNVLEQDYLEIARLISQSWSILGAWGGQIVAEFEKKPSDWTKPYWGFLAIREFERDTWSNLLHQHETTPSGAGLCIRRIVAEKYADLVRNDPKRLNMDRKGKLLVSCGDSDLAFTACDIGLGTGLFTSLKLTHLIPPSRLEEEYLIKLCEGIYYSLTFLAYFRGKMPPKPSGVEKLFEYYILLRMNPRDRRIYNAQRRGKALAIQEILNT
jgi:glycosyltransferase involved in cell wall biosynthesis